MQATLVQIEANQERMQMKIGNAPLVAANMMRNNSDHLFPLFNADNQVPVGFPLNKQALRILTNLQINPLLDFYGINYDVGNNLLQKRVLLSNFIGGI